MHQLIKDIYSGLLPEFKLESVKPHDPIKVSSLPHPWKLLGTGNYAAVVCHPDYPEEVVKIYAPGRPGFEEEVEVYHRLGSHPAFSECYYAEKNGEVNFLVLKRLYGITLYDAIQKGLTIPKKVILDIDRALEYARMQGLYPHDVHGRNVMMHEGRGFVVDVSDFLHEEECAKWENLKRAYYWLYRPILAPLKLRIPYSLLDVVRKSYRFFGKLKMSVLKQLGM